MQRRPSREGAAVAFEGRVIGQLVGYSVSHSDPVFEDDDGSLVIHLEVAGTHADLAHVASVLAARVEERTRAADAPPDPIEPGQVWRAHKLSENFADGYEVVVSHINEGRVWFTQRDGGEAPLFVLAVADFRSDLHLVPEAP